MPQPLPHSTAPRWACAFALAAALLASLSGTVRADTFRILSDDREAFQARVDLIQQARCQIDVAYYAVDCGHSAMAFLALLRDAADRGVRVRLIVDGLVNRIPGAMKEHLIQHGVQIREFHTFHLYRPLQINQRMHDKLLVVDGEQMILGSRNLRDRHFALGPCWNYVNRDAYVRGCAACSASRYFDCQWNSRDVDPPKFDDRRGDVKFHQEACSVCLELMCNPSPQRAGQMLDQAMGELQTSGWMQMHTGRDWSEGQPQVPARFMYDPPVGHKTPFAGIEFETKRYLDSACHSIIIETPFFVMTHTMKRTLKAALRRGVRVCVVTNSIASVDSILAQAQYENEKRELLRAGFELWEYAGPDRLHAKSAVIDGRIAIVGSYNFDARSDSQNTEVAVAVEDCEVAAELRSLIRRHMHESYHLDRRGRAIGTNARHPGATHEQLRKVRAARVLSPWIRRYL